MSNDKVVTMPGVLNTSARVITSNELKAESNLLDDLQALLEKYNGKVTNLSMVGALTIYANQVMLGSLLGEDDEL
tara:strand:+ start:709 stop:933 length:225 start_codon:yes stop_codon:yes gene_type:complete